jgi:sodium/proline symporter
VTGLDGAVTTTVAAVMAAYLVALLVIGWIASRRTHGGEDFHLAGRSLGAWAAGISSTASSESGWVTLGAVGMTYVHGVSGLWFAPGCLLGYLVNVFVVAPRLRRSSAADGSVTLTDVLTRHWGDPRNVLRVVATAIVLVCMMGYVAAQMTAAGKAFSSSLGLEGRAGYVLGVLVGAAVITLVTTLGGFRAVAWTDLFQGLLMAAALLALPAYAIARFGGFGEVVNALGAVDPALLTATGGRVGSALFGFVVGNLGIGLGYPGMPHVVTRYMAARSDREIRRLRVIAVVWGVAVFYGAGLVGLVGRAMHPDLPDGEQTLMVLALELTHPVIAGLLLAAVLSAVLSTVSSQLLVAASAVSYDVVEEALGRARDDRRSLVLGRWTVAIVGAIGVLVALTEVRLVFWFVLFAWSGLGAAFAPLVLLSLSRREVVNRHGALAAMLTGVGVTVVWKLGRDAATAPGAYAAAWWAVLVAAAAILLLGRIRDAMDVGDRGAVLAAAGLTLAAWWLVGRWGLDQLYELVPAFALATAAAVAVSQALPIDPPATGHGDDR